MVADFVIPKHSCKQVFGASSCSSNANVADVLDDLNDHDALFIVEEDAYERCEALARSFLQLLSSQRSQAVDVLAANLRFLCTSAQQLLSDQEEAPSPESLQKHKNGLKMIVHLLHIIAMQAQKDAEASKGAENAAAKPSKAAGRGRKAAADEGCSGWDWQHSRQQVLLAVHDVMRTDLRTIFKGLTAAERMVNLCMELALQALEVPTVAKQEGGWPAVCDVLIRGAVQHEQLDFVAAALMERARKHEHVPPLAAQAAKYAEEKYNSTQLAVKLLDEFWSCSPEDYDNQYATNSKSVRQAGEVVVLLAELLPKVVSNHIAQLRPYLACSKAYSIRGALMAATGSVLLQVFPSSTLSSSLGAGAAQAHLRSKETLLGLLHARILDKAAYVRQRVLQTWARLVEESCVPINHWNLLLTQAIGRLEDESQLVVKAALQLLCKMLHQGIFPPPLDTQTYINSQRQAEEELDALLPAGRKQKGDLGEGRGEGGGQEDDDESEGGENDEGGAAADGQEEDEEETWQSAAVKMEAGSEDAAAAKGEAEQEHGELSGDGSPSTAASSPNHAAVSRLRALIANLKEGAAFCKRLGASLKQVQVLLASSQAGVVHDAIVFLTMCKSYEVTDAAQALRGMWPLVFSKVEAVRESVLDSWNILHLHDKTAKEQVSELVTEVVPGCTLAELTALETILSALSQQSAVSAPALVHLLFQDMCHYFTKLQEHQQAQRERSRRRQRSLPAEDSNSNRSEAAAMDVDSAAAHGTQADPAAAAGAGGAEAGLARSELVDGLRHVFAVLSMLSAAQPSVVKAKYVPVLLEVAFSPDLGDAWVARHAFITLRHAAPHLVPTPLPLSAAAAAPTAAAASSDPVSPELHQAMLAAAVRLLVGHPAASMAPNWPSAAEAAVAAVYALSPNPQEVLAAVLEEMFRRCRPTGGSQASEQTLPGFSAAALSRFFFVLGRTSLQHLLCIESLGKAVRQTRLAAGRAAAEAADRAREAAAAAGAAAGTSKGAGKRGGGKAAAAATAAAAAAQQQADDIAGMLGAGAVTADAELDDLVDMIEAQVLSKEQLVGRYGGLLSSMAHLRAFITYPQELQSAALLALTQLMAVDREFCAANVALLFTLLHKRLVSAPVRVNMVVALADLASRWPNVLEPWTAYMYEPLSDPEPSVKLAALSSLTHLVLGGMVKAKGNVAKVAMLLVDDNQELVDRAVLFFESLAASGSGSSRSAGSAAAGASAANPVYNLLPDCLSALLAKAAPPLREEQMQVIMSQLLGYVKDKQAESLRERLVVRLQMGGPREWRLVGWCIERLGYSEKGLKKVMEMTACYRHTLGEQQVFDMFMTMAKKGGYKASAAAAAGAAGVPGLPGDFSASLSDWVADLVASREAAVEAAEVEALTAAKQQEQQQGEGGAPEQEQGEPQQHPRAEGLSDSGTGAEVAGGARPCQQQQDGRAAQQPAGQGGEEAAAAAPAAGGGGDVLADEADLQSQQIELVQSQDIASNEDLEPMLLEAAAAAAVATAGLQRMSLVGSSGSSQGTAAVAGRGRRSVAATAAVAAGRPAAAGSTRASRAARAGAGGGSTSSRAPSQVAATRRDTSRSKGKAACPDSSGDDIESSDDGSDDDGSASEVVAAAAKAGRASRGTAAAARGTRSSRHSAQQADAAAGTDSSSEDDD